MAIQRKEDVPISNGELDLRRGIGEKVFLAFTNPRAGEEPDFEVWYSYHLKDITDVAGFMWGERMVAAADQPPDQILQWKFVAIYGFEGDTNVIHQNLLDAHEGMPPVPGAHALHPEYSAWVYKRHQPLVVNRSLDDRGTLDLRQGLGEHVLITFTSPWPGREDEFESWYETRLREVTDTDGFIWGERLVADPDQRPGQATRWKYVSLHAFEGRTKTILDRLGNQDAASDSLDMSDAVHPAYVSWVYSRHQPLIVHAERQEGEHG